MTRHLQIGEIGEEIAIQFLQKRRFKIIERNVNRKWGELDIVAMHKNSKQIHIVEVKTVSGSKASAQAHPVENLTKHKLEKLKRTAILYTQEHGITNWQLDAILVWYDPGTKQADIQILKHIGD